MAGTDLNKDMQLCQDALGELRSCTEHCRDFADRVENSVCKVTLSAVAFCCDAAVKSLEKCIEICNTGMGRKAA